MTREEAIKELSVEYLGDSEKMIKAKEMAIKALEQDTVSKESYNHEYFLRRKMEAEIDHLRRYISKLETQITLEQEPTTKNDSEVGCIVDVLGSYTDLDIPYKREIAEDILYKLPSVTPQEPRWIPVSERLPEGYGEYLITWKNPKYPKSYIGICECEITDVYDYEHNRFEVKWLFDGYITTAYPDSYVVAWMPLPTLYEPQGSEEKG